ncbi:L-threonylcarbamoyladenylate synthase [Acinetobacter sp. WZC-1]|uniref:L-threonylcarbamoyladenylate synthase n=1 Tax=Acinetobacter sp. WZC-1 TaxID=3459034 RepID=UPI00403E186D
MNKLIQWNQAIQPEAVDILSRAGGMIVSPTKVGYIVMTTDRVGLERKFDAKQRKRNKPGVVLCGSLQQLRELAEMNPEIEKFYEQHWQADVLLGCILPWKEQGRSYIPQDGSETLMMDQRQTSCFVIKFGVPSENIVAELWNNNKTLCFASSANPSGQGNRGLVTGIGERITAEADLIIEADAYVDSIQPASQVINRYEQGVMVSLVDEQGQLIPAQKGERQISPYPVVIRKGLDIDFILSSLAQQFNSWSYMHGSYY